MSDLDVLEAIAWHRRSVRAFLPESVDRNLIERAVAVASRAPSSCNTQPWRLHIVSGSCLKRLRVALLATARAGLARRSEVEHAAPYEGIYRERQVQAAVALFRAQNVARDDREARTASFLRNYAFFDAPHAAFLFMPADGGLREAADCGKFAQTFMLALAAAGLGSCPQGSLSDYPDIVRDTVGLKESGRLLLGVSFGHPAGDDPSANVRVPRAATADIAVFHD